ncbi:MAG: hypothetical protein WAW41_04595, partial [Methylobacter sp.]
MLYLIPSSYRREKGLASKLNGIEYKTTGHGVQTNTELVLEQVCAGSQSPDWEPRRRSSSFLIQEAGASNTEFPSWRSCESIIQIRLKGLFTTENTKDTEKII